MRTLFLILTLTIGLADNADRLVDNADLIKKNKEWSEKWTKVICIRNEKLRHKYGQYWYQDSIYKHIPKEELNTDLMKKLRSRNEKATKSDRKNK